MTVSEIINQITAEYGSRHQITEAQALLLLNQIQLMAFDEDLEAFLSYTQYLTVDSGEGPYDFPTTPPCRKFLGVTTLTIPQLLGYTRFGLPASSDYGMQVGSMLNPRRKYLPISLNVIDRNFTFLEEPTTTSDTYRMVYYRNPETIRSTTDDARLLIPSQYHYSMCVQGSIALADYTLYNDKVSRPELRTYLQPYWDFLDDQNDPDRRDCISEGSGPV